MLCLLIQKELFQTSHIENSRESCWRDYQPNRREGFKKFRIASLICEKAVLWKRVDHLLLVVKDHSFEMKWRKYSVIIKSNESQESLFVFFHSKNTQDRSANIIRWLAWKKPEPFRFDYIYFDEISRIVKFLYINVGTFFINDLLLV